MTPGDWVRVILALVFTAGTMVALRWAAHRFRVGPELARKSAHVVLGCACMALPWCFTHPLPVWVLAGGTTLLMLGLRRSRRGVGDLLHGVARVSHGDILFMPAVALVFQLSRGDRLLHVIPIAVLSIADAAAAVAGSCWARKTYMSGTGFKSHLGSAVFLVSAWGCVALPLVLSGRVDGLSAMMVGGVLAVLAMMAEGMSDRGFDNLVVPVLTSFLLVRFLPLTHGELATRWLTALFMGAVTVVGGRWSTLDGGALLGAALLGYACAFLGDWRFVLPPAAVFLCHLFTTRKHALRLSHAHRLDAVLSHGLSCLPWVLMADRRWLAADVCLAGISFAMGAHLSLLDSLTRMRVPGIRRAAWISPVKGWVVAAVPGLLGLWPDWRSWWLPALTSAAAGFAMVLGVRRCDRWFSRDLVSGRYAVGALALAASVIGVILMSGK